MQSGLNKEVFSSLEKSDLSFDENDRKDTLNRIKQLEYKKQDNKMSLLKIGKRYAAPILGTVMALVLAVLVLLPNLDPGKALVTDEQQASQSEDEAYSILLMGKDSADANERRSTINILLTYNNNDKSMYIVPLPRDTYVDIFNPEGEVIGKDKLMLASAYESELKGATLSVSDLLGISIDYHAVISEENIYIKMGISKEGIRNNRGLISEMGNIIKEELTASGVKDIVEESKNNVPSDLLNQMKDNNSDSIRVIDVEDGIEAKEVNGVYYVEIEGNLLEETSDTLKTHLSK